MPLNRDDIQIYDQDGRDLAPAVLESITKVLGSAGLTGPDVTIDDLKKAGEVITTGSGLVAINLEAPAKDLVAAPTPIANALPRVTISGNAGTGPQWKEITSINGPSGAPILPWLREGQRSAKMQATFTDKSASYATIGLDTDITFEAQHAAQGFQDAMALNTMLLLRQAKFMEEAALIGGNRSVALGTAATPTLAASGSGATLPAATYSVRVFALTYEGWRMATVTGGIIRQVTLTGADGQTYTVNGGSSAADTAATQAITLGQTLFCSVTAIEGAVAYAWYVGTAGNEKLEAITTINSVAFSAPLAGTGQALSAVANATTDYSRNNGSGGNNAPAFDGLLYASFANASAINTYLATGTAGTGTVLTASGRGTITQVDTVLKGLWDSFLISPEVIWCNAQEINNIASKIFGGTANGALRYGIQLNGNAPELTAGVSTIMYPNLFHLGDKPVIPIKVHPHMPPGTMMFWAQSLPPTIYNGSDTPGAVARVQCRRDWYQVPWPVVTRRNEIGVYAEEVLQVYAPWAIATLSNIANG